MPIRNADNMGKKKCQHVSVGICRTICFILSLQEFQQEPVSLLE